MIYQFCILFLQLIQTDIDSHKPTVEAINESANELGSERDPNYQAQLGDLNTRFERIIVRSRHRKDLLSSLIDKLTQLQEEVSDLEDWLLPVADTLEAHDLMSQDLPELASRLQVKQDVFALFVINKATMETKIRQMCSVLLEIIMEIFTYAKIQTATNSKLVKRKKIFTSVNIQYGKYICELSRATRLNDIFKNTKKYRSCLGKQKRMG